MNTRPDESGSVQESDIKHIINSYVYKYGLVKHQKDSFDQFLTDTLPHIIKENSDLKIQHEDDTRLISTFSFHNARTPKPNIIEANGFVRDITPNEARLRGITYSSSVFVDIHQVTTCTESGEVVRRVFSDVLLARLPIMIGTNFCGLRSIDAVHEGGECWYDQGGYFIVNGVEKGFVAQEKLKINYPFIFKQKGDKKKIINCEIRSCHEKKLRSTSTLYINASSNKGSIFAEVTISVPFVPVPVPFTWMMILLNVTTISQMRMLLINEKEDSPGLISMIDDFLALQDSLMINRDEVENLLCKKRHDKTSIEARLHMQHILTNEVLPHVGLDSSVETKEGKAWFIAFCLRRMARTYLGELHYDDRDHYANKRIDTAGGLMSLLFRQLYRAFLKQASSQFSKFVLNSRVNNIVSYISHKKITSGFRYAFATGNWGIQKSSSTQMGVVQVLSRMTTVAPISNLQRTNTPLCREGKTPEPRQLHSSSWGIVCAAETPEGGSCGLMKNLCLLTHVRIQKDSGLLWEQICSMSMIRECIGVRCEFSIVPVFLNGICKAFLPKDKCDNFISIIRTLRRQMIIPCDTSVCYYPSIPCVQITSDRGALCRPVFVTENIYKLRKIVDSNPGSLRLNLWTELLSHGVIEYIEKEEEETLHIGMRLGEVGVELNTYTHYEIHPTVINGLCAGQIPFSDHNQAPRNCYQSAMGKQAIGVYATNYLQRMDNAAHVLTQPQRPLVTTWTDEMLQTPQIPAGANAIVVIMCWGGYNQEDSVILNRTSLDNGMFGSIMYKSYREETKPNASDLENFEFPDEEICTNMKTNNYATLCGQAVAPIGTDVYEGDVIIGKTITSRDIGQSVTGKKRDNSIYVRNNEKGTVDMTMTVTGEASKIVKVRIRELRKPQIGDKLASRHGQKGVIGMIYDEKDMPFAADGTRPDIIVNPHAIPSRMTIGMLIEMLLGKECLVSGEFGDGTPFRGTSVSQIQDSIELHGGARDGTEVLYNAFTGEKIESRVFMAPAYYQRLKHMVTDKIHARGRGPVQLLTRQPNEGRARDGGLRFGEMERDCVVAHGCAATLRECLCEKSDPYLTIACTTCGILCEPFHSQVSVQTEVKPIGYCRNCRSVDGAIEVRMPYAMKLLLQELQALHVFVRFRFRKIASDDIDATGAKVEIFDPVYEFV